jgi:hypothetical protein
MSIMGKIREANPVDIALIVVLIILAVLPIVGIDIDQKRASATAIESPATPEGRIDTGTLAVPHQHDANSICARKGEECDY